MVELYSTDIKGSYFLGRRLAILVGVFMGVVSMFMYVSYHPFVSMIFFPMYIVQCTIYIGKKII